MGIRHLFFFAAFAMAAGCEINPVSDFNPEGFGMSEGEECSGDPEPWSACISGLVCSAATGTCVDPSDEAAEGTTGEDGACAATAECAYGLVCAAEGTCQADGSAGTADAGESCEEASDCQAGLQCLDGVCEGVQVSGMTCAPPPPEGAEAIKVYFEIPGYAVAAEGEQDTDTDTASEPEAAQPEFYRLPFPNDIRMKDGHIDLAGHPKPSDYAKDITDPVAEYFKVLEEDSTGFGTQSEIFFRLNYYPDGETISLIEDKEEEIEQTVYLIDIDPDSSEYGLKHGVGFRAASRGGKYICSNWLTVLPPPGNPLSPGTTYAAILTDGILDKEGNPLSRDAGFDLVMDDAEPAEGAARAAWEAYAPLRSYLERGDGETVLDGSRIAAAAVFTTADPTWKVRAIRASVLEQDAPIAADAALDEGDALFRLETGTLTVPFYQEGTRPFVTSEDGGAIRFDDDGAPVVVETEAVRYALTLPAVETPADGFPVIIYAHGTGGDEMSFVDNDVAARMATLGAAVIGLEQVQHGERRGLSAAQEADSAYDPGNLFYNLFNPRAARDNNLQAAADLFQTVRYIEQRAAETGELDTSRVYFFGHSQGAQGSFIGATYEPAIKGVVLSGAGGYLIETLLGKKSPVDAATAVKLLLLDPDVSPSHPVLNLVQVVFDPVDPTNFADAVFRKDLSDEGIVPRDVFMASGTNDSYTPEKSQEALARALWLHQSVTSGTPFEAVWEVEELPHSRTYGFGGGVTAVAVRYAPSDGEDGHFVMFDNPDAVRQADHFIATMIDPDYDDPVLASPEGAAAQ